MLLGALVGAALAVPLQAQVADEVFVVAFNGSNVLRYDGNGNFVDTVIPTENQLLNPHSIVRGPDGNLYVTSTGKDKVRRYAPDGTPIDNFVKTAVGGLDAPTHAEFGPDGHFYVASFNTGQILRYDGTTGDFLDVFVDAGSGGLGTPEIFAFGPDGNLYVPAGDQNRVLRYNGQTGAFLDVFISPADGLDDPHDIAFGPNGECYLPSFESNSVLKYDVASGAFLGQVVSPGSGGLSGPHGVALHADGKLYVTSFATNQVLRYTTDGVFDGVFIESGNGLSAPVHVLFEPDATISLIGPVPGTPGLESSFRAFSGLAGNATVFLWGTVLGAVPICPAGALHVLDLQFFGTVAPDANGLSELTVPVPPGVSGVEVFFQAIEAPSCRTSQVVRFEFP